MAAFVIQYNYRNDYYYVFVLYKQISNNYRFVIVILLYGSDIK